MNDTDIRAELIEYQWRRKFERGPRRTWRVSVISALCVLAAVVIAAHSVVYN